ncbi:unnamed protein product, partial [Didymodactylos carnosus]
MCCICDQQIREAVARIYPRAVLFWGVFAHLFWLEVTA